MANQRPIRRPRVPSWKRGKRRPTRWNAVTNQADDAVMLNSAVFPTIPDGNPPIAILVDGQIDVEPWADEQEVTVDRIVGAIHLHGHWIQDVATGSGNTLTPKMPLIKMGIVLHEEISKDSTAGAPTRNLFDQEDLEDVEWMWLWSGFPDNHWATTQPVNTTGGAPTTNGAFAFALSVPVDIRNRRKVGQSDALALYAEWASPNSGYTIDVQSYTDVRIILMSR